MKPALEVNPSFAAVVAAFAGKKNVRYGKLMSSFGLKVNGKIFAMLVRGELVVKLPHVRVGELTTTGVGRPFEPRRGRPMKEWILIKPGTADWIALAREAHQFVGARRPPARQRARP